MRLSRLDWPFAVVLAVAAVAWTLPLRAPNCNTSSHYALVQSIASGERTIDSLHGESCDISWWRGHYYSNKAPGLALVSVPWYLLLRAVGAVSLPRHGVAYPKAMRDLPRRDLWLMALWGATVPALLLLWVVRRFAEDRVAGTGTASAAVLAFATILLPFGGLFFSHALSALLDFSAYAVLGRSISRRRAALAGMLAGAAVVVEYPNAIVALLLAALVAHQAKPRLGTSLSFAAALSLGVAPLLAYNQWAFGSPFHVSYIGAVLVPGISGHAQLGANSAGFFGVQAPSGGHLVSLLVGDRGLVYTSPLLLLAPLGLRQLWRMRLRQDVVVISTIAIAFLIYNAGYYSPIGGATPGPRFLIVVFPFLSMAVAIGARRRSRFAALLLTIGSPMLFAAYLTQPLIGHHYTMLSWWRWIRAGSFTSTLLDPARHTWEPAASLLLALIGALLVAGQTLHKQRATELTARAERTSRL